MSEEQTEIIQRQRILLAQADKLMQELEADRQAWRQRYEELRVAVARGPVVRIREKAPSLTGDEARRILLARIQGEAPKEEA